MVELQPVSAWNPAPALTRFNSALAASFQVELNLIRFLAHARPVKFVASFFSVGRQPFAAGDNASLDDSASP
jgi:hypothetical protein